MASKLISQLAKHTQALINPVAYGHMRGKLNKKGFSEISMYAAMARHCEENDISPYDMAEDMLALIKGCSEHEFFIRTSNDFPYLRREYNELRHGDIDKGEMKSPEQRGQFLCNNCHLVKQASEKAGKNHCCKICMSQKSKDSFEKKKRQKKEAEKLLPPAVVVDKPVITPKADVLPEEPKPGLDIDALSNKKETVTLEARSGKMFQITQIIGDESETEFKIICPTENLPEVLGALKDLNK